MGITSVAWDVNGNAIAPGQTYAYSLCPERPAEGKQSGHHLRRFPYIAAVRRSVSLPALAAFGLAASMVAFGVMPAQADGSDSVRALSKTQPAQEPEPVQFTLMGDSHITLMMSDLFPGAYVNGAEGTWVDEKFVIYALNGLKLSQVVNGRGVVKAGVSVVGTTDVGKWRKALRTGPDTVVVNLGTNDGGPKARDIDKFMRLAGKDRRVFWIAPYYTSCPACRAIHDFELKAADKRHANLEVITVKDLHLDVSADGLHAFGRANSSALWNRINEAITPAEG